MSRFVAKGDPCLLEVHNLKAHFPVKRGVLSCVRGIWLEAVEAPTLDPALKRWAIVFRPAGF